MQKIAQEINFADKEGVERVFSKMRDSEFDDMIATFAAIHELISQDKELDILDAALNVTDNDPGANIIARYINKYIGEDQFKRNSFELISSQINSIRAAGASSTTIIREPIVTPETSTIPDSAEIDEVKSTVDIDNDLIRPDFLDRIEAAKLADYPDDNAEQVSNSFKNIHIFLSKIKESNSQEDINSWAEQMEGTLEFLELLEVLGISGADVDKELDSIKKSKIVKPGSTSLSKEEFEEEKLSHTNFKTMVSTLTLGDAVNHPILNGIKLIDDGGLNVETIPNTLNALDIIYNNAKKELVNYSIITNNMLEANNRYLSESMSRNGERLFSPENNRIDKSILVSFNNLFYAIKATDIYVRRAIGESLKTEEGKAAAKELSNLSEKLLVNRFILDEAFFKETILLTLAYFTVRDLGLLYSGIKTFADMKNEPSLAEVAKLYESSPIKGNDLASDTEEAISKVLWSKFRTQLTYSSMDAPFNPNLPMMNFIASVSVDKRFIAMNLKNRVLRVSNDIGSVLSVKCPACTRPIKWSGKAMKRVNLIQSRGTYIPLYSFYANRQNEDGTNYSEIITERHLAEGGPYPPPDANSIGNDALLKSKDSKGNISPAALVLMRTRDAVSKYTGNKTWAEISEMITSNDPELHEEGLQRRAGALAYLGVKPLVYSAKGKSGSQQIFKDISKIMFACPFSVDVDKNNQAGDEVLDLNAQLDIVYNKLVYPEDEESQAMLNNIFESIDSLREELDQSAMEGTDTGLIFDQIKIQIEKANILAGKEADFKNENAVNAEVFSSSGCGLKLTPYENEPNKMYVGANANPTAKKYVWRPDNLDGEQAAYAKSKLSGGYKFSKTIFRCPARISRPSAEDLGIFKNIAIPKAGPFGISNGDYSPPTSERGYAEYDNIDEGTFSYLVCGTATSLSSFDRSANGEGSVYNILRKLLNTYGGDIDSNRSQQAAAKEIIEFLIAEGVDYMDVISPIGAVLQEDNKESYAASKSDRINKIAELLVLAQKQMPEQFAKIHDLVLSCPHGHKFSIKQSVDFGNTHSSVNKSRSKNTYKMVKELYFLSGPQSLEAAKRVGLIVRADPLDDLNIKTFNELGNEDYDLSKIGFMLPELNGHMNLWKFSQNLIPIMRTHIFQESANSSHKDLIANISLEDVQFGGSFLSDIASSIDGENEDAAINKISAAKGRDEDDGGAELSRSIEGIHPDNYSDNLSALIKALRAALKIVITWDSRAIEPEFFNKVIQNIDVNVDGIAEAVLSTGGLFYTEDEGLSADTLNVIAQGVTMRLKSYAVLTNSFQGKNHVETATSLVAAAIIDTVYDLKDKLDEDIEFDVDLDSTGNDFDFVYDKISYYFEGFYPAFKSVIPHMDNPTEAVLKSVKDYVSREPALSLLYAVASYYTKTTGTPSSKLRERYGDKIFLLAYARYLANAISIIYNECLSPVTSISGNYIGYNIGIDLSSAEKVLNINIDDLRLLNDDVNIKPNKDGLDDDKYFLSCKNVLYAYNNIIGKMAIARNMAITPIGLAEAKNALLKKIGVLDDPMAHAVYSATFPVSTIDFSPELVSYGNINIPNSFGSSGKNKDSGRVIPNEPNTLPPIESPVLRSDGSVVTDKRGNPVTKPVYIHPDVNFDSSKFQIGMIGNKSSETISWPFDKADSFVGVNLPFLRDKTSNVGYISYTPVYDFRFVIDIDGTPQDISFLFKRGRNPAQVSQLKKLYKALDEYEEQRGLAKEDSESAEEDDAIDAQIDQAIRETHAAIKMIPLEVNSTSTFVSSENILSDGSIAWKSVQHASALLVGPKEAFKLIDNVDLFKNMLSTKPNPVLLTKFVEEVYGLGLIRDIVQESYNKLIANQKNKGIEFTINGENSIFNLDLDPDNKEEANTIRAINSAIVKNYKEHLGKFYDIVPSGADGSGTNLVIIEDELPSITYNVKKKDFEVNAGPTLGVPPSIGKMSSRAKTADLFGTGNEGLVGSEYLQKAQEAMIEYVSAHATGRLGASTIEASSNTEHIQKIAKRRRYWERTILTMGDPSVNVDDLID
jgi:hypothetical protein